MSVISSVSSGATLSLLQQLQQQQAPGSSNRVGFAAQRRADFGAALQAAGVDPSKVGDIQTQIDAAIQNVRKDGTSNDRAAVKSAVESVLQKNGVDTTKFDQALKAAHAKRAGSRRRAGGDGDGDADDGGTAPSVNESTEAGNASPLASLLGSIADGTSPTSQLYGIPVGGLVDVAA